MNKVERKPPEVPGETLVAETERALRVNLAAGYRLMAHFQMTDLIYTHISARIPGPKDEFLINPYGVLFEDITASNLVKVDAEGAVIDDTTGLGISRTGFLLHSSIHMARPEVQCVLHAHTTATITVASQEHGLLPISQQAMFLHDQVRYLDYSGLFRSDQQRRDLAEALGDKSIMMLRNHGPIIAGTSVAQAFSLMYFLEFACRVQVATLSSSADYVQPDLSHVEQASAAFANQNTSLLGREWRALIGLLDRLDPSYAD